MDSFFFFLHLLVVAVAADTTQTDDNQKKQADRDSASHFFVVLAFLANTVGFAELFGAVVAVRNAGSGGPWLLSPGAVRAVVVVPHGAVIATALVNAHVGAGQIIVATISVVVATLCILYTMTNTGIGLVVSSAAIVSRAIAVEVVLAVTTDTGLTLAHIRARDHEVGLAV